MSVDNQGGIVLQQCCTTMTAKSGSQSWPVPGRFVPVWGYLMIIMANERDTCKDIFANSFTYSRLEANFLGTIC